MKLRIRGDSVRIRLSQTEVRSLIEHGRIEESARLGPEPSDVLVYGVVIGTTESAIACSWLSGRLLVVIPPALAQDWAAGETVGLAASQPVVDGAVLRILIEKDLACTTPRPEEDDRDAFPNPGGCAVTRAAAPQRA